MSLTRGVAAWHRLVDCRRTLTAELISSVGLKAMSEPLSALRAPGESGGGGDLKDLLRKVSLTEYDLQQVSALDGIEERSAASDYSQDSAELSEEAASEMTEFDAPQKEEGSLLKGT